MQKQINQAVKEAMPPLTQDILEKLLQNSLPDQAPYIAIYFTAKWCGPCNALPLDKIIMLNKNIMWYICDVDENKYSSGYCGIKSVPSFMGVINGKPTQLLATSNSTDIFKWVQDLHQLPKK
jgi:thioredoxin-like negative regulator of GroEL